MTTTPLFSEISIQLTKTLTKKEKQQNGIFFTPSSITNLFIQSLCSHLDLSKIYSVIEPSCGSGEFIQPLLTTSNSSSPSTTIQIEWIKGIELHPVIFQKVSKIQNDKLEWINKDFLQTNISSDIFIGNPPYFVIPKSQVHSSYLKYIEGRPNIFVLFILHALQLLNQNGFIAFVIPSSFLNSKYYEKTRKYILENFTIRDIISFDNQNDFIETKQSTIGLIVQKKKDEQGRNKNFLIQIGNQVMFFDKDCKKKLDELYFGSTSIKDLGLQVKTGPYVWNEHKDELTSEPNEESIFLVYNTNIVQNKFEKKEFKNKEKKQYVSNNEQKQKGPMIVVNRGNGNSEYHFTYSYLDKTIEGKGYTVENHLNMIQGKKEKLLKVMESFASPKTKEFLKLYCGNNGLSKTEIETILPIYL
jgi:adenine-specific DNA-methyltransferase